jgi:myosin heavy subunit
MTDINSIETTVPVLNQNKVQQTAQQQQQQLQQQEEVFNADKISALLQELQEDDVQMREIEEKTNADIAGMQEMLNYYPGFITGFETKQKDATKILTETQEMIGELEKKIDTVNVEKAKKIEELKDTQLKLKNTKQALEDTQTNRDLIKEELAQCRDDIENNLKKSGEDAEKTAKELSDSYLVVKALKKKLNSESKKRKVLQSKISEYNNIFTSQRGQLDGLQKTAEGMLQKLLAKNVKIGSIFNKLKDPVLNQNPVQTSQQQTQQQPVQKSQQQPVLNQTSQQQVKQQVNEEFDQDLCCDANSEAFINLSTSQKKLQCKRRLTQKEQVRINEIKDKLRIDNPDKDWTTENGGINVAAYKQLLLENPVSCKVKEAQQVEQQVRQQVQKIQQTQQNLIGGKRRVNLRWRNVSARVLLGGYKRDSLNRMAKRWGIKNPKALSKKGDLTKVMHFVMYAKYGDVSKRNQLNAIAKNLGLNPKQYRKKIDLYNAINQKTSKLSFNLRGGKRRTKKN